MALTRGSLGGYEKERDLHSFAPRSTTFQLSGGPASSGSGFGDFEGGLFASGYGGSRVSTAAGRGIARNGSQLARLSLTEGGSPLSRCLVVIDLPTIFRNVCDVTVVVGFCVVFYGRRNCCCLHRIETPPPLSFPRTVLTPSRLFLTPLCAVSSGIRMATPVGGLSISGTIITRSSANLSQS